MLDPLAVQERAVGALQIADREERALANDLGVLAGNARRQNLIVARLITPHRKGKAVQLDAFRGLARNLAFQPIQSR